MNVNATLFTTTLLFSLGLSSPAFAKSVPFDNPKKSDLNDVFHVTGKSTTSNTSGNTGVTMYDYPDVPATEVTQTGVLFFYTQDLLDYFEGDITKIYDFVDSSIEVNNTAFENGGIGLRRVVAGVLPMPDRFVDADMYNSDIGSATTYFGWGITGVESYHDFYEDDELGQRVRRSGQKALLDEMYGQYGASYYVALARRYVAPSEDVESEYSWVGLAMRGGELSVVTPYGNEKHEITILAHELGHNDGLRHNEEVEEGIGHMGPYAAGYFCDNNYSLMDTRGFSYNEDHFFSDMNHTDTSTGEACGKMDVADAALSYRAVIDAGWIAEKKEVFANLRDVNERKGYASIQFDDVVFNEAEGAITGTVLWEGLSPEDNASLEVVVSDYQEANIADFYGPAYANVQYTGEITSSFSIPLANDDEFEIDKNVTFALRSPNGVNLDESMTEATVAIASDDAGEPGIFSFASSPYSLEEGGSITVTVTRTEGADGEVILQLISEGGTASGSDYTAVDEKLVFANGETEKSITFNAASDSLSESNETVILRLINDNAKLGTAEVTVTITNKTTNSGTTGSTGGSESNGGGGGSMGWSALGLLLVAIFRRRTR